MIIFVEQTSNQNKSLNIKNPLKLFGVESAEYNDPTIIEDIDQGDEYSENEEYDGNLEIDVIVLQLSQKITQTKINQIHSQLPIIIVLDMIKLLQVVMTDTQI